MISRELYEELRDELIRANKKCTARQEAAVTIVRSRTAALNELARLRKVLATVTEERDRARYELRRVCSGAGFKIPEGTPS